MTFVSQGDRMAQENDNTQFNPATVLYLSQQLMVISKAIDYEKESIVKPSNIRVSHFYRQVYCDTR